MGLFPVMQKEQEFCILLLNFQCALENHNLLTEFTDHTITENCWGWKGPLETI